MFEGGRAGSSGSSSNTQIAWMFFAGQSGLESLDSRTRIMPGEASIAVMSLTSGAIRRERSPVPHPISRTEGFVSDFDFRIGRVFLRAWWAALVAA